MNQKTLTEIDYFRIREQVAAFCVSEEGKVELLNREPLSDSKKIEFLKSCSREWLKYVSTCKNNPVSGWPTIGALFSIIKTNGASLSLEQVKALGLFTLSVKKVREAVVNHQTELELKTLAKQVELLPEEDETEKKIFRIITPDGELRDLPEIAAIRSQIASLNQKIKNIMRTFTSDPKLATVLESSVPVLRGGRQVLAVKSNQQNRIPGIIYEVSQTGQTVYIEPEDAVRCSNELIQKEHELEAEIKRILTELTESLQPSIPFFRDALPVMKTFDTTLAACRWGIENNCVYALECVGEPPLLLQARHPLLGAKAVPIDIRFMDGKRVLIITGPNTGGKTVTLKTFALFAMLNQAGFPVLAEEGTRLPVFSNVFADIGDDQSLDQSLSTFSGHMRNIAQAVNAAKNDTLVLLDELGSGTDPQEGTAIAMSVLDKLIEKQSFVLVTTHQGILKNYGYTNPACINASVEFDTSTLSPSYHLLMGVPGESHALDIAQKSGLPKEIVSSARNYIATEQADVSALIRGLNRKHIELNKLKDKAEHDAAVYEEKMLRLKEKEIDVRKKEHDLKKGKQQELNDFLIHSRRQLENLVRELREGELTRDKTLGVKGFINNLEKDVNRLEEKFEAEEEKIERAEQEFEKELAQQRKYTSNKKTKKKLSNAEALKLATPMNNPDDKKASVAEIPVTFGPEVAVKSKVTGIEGVIAEEGKKGYWVVQFGSVRMSVKEKDLIIQKNQTKKLVPSVSYDLAPANETERPVFELRLLGMRTDEAIKALERQIDLCALNNFPHFSVIHGKGDGILQQFVTDYLSHCEFVKEFSFAPAEDGGTGKTYVTLK
ncbi:MAG: Smr/MutS family protein [Treponema sp.]|nr:Smr/MutS family protein [Treponema sp.]